MVTWIVLLRGSAARSKKAFLRKFWMCNKEMLGYGCRHRVNECNLGDEPRG